MDDWTRWKLSTIARASRCMPKSLYIQEFVRFVENDEYEPELQADQREEDENH
jgi:hypothetical protein